MAEVVKTEKGFAGPRRREPDQRPSGITKLSDGAATTGGGA